MILRPYQTEVIERARSAMKVHRRVLLQLPTGGGKTVISGTMMHGCVKAGWRIWFLCHRQELIDQTAKTLRGLGIEFGYVAAGYPKAKREQVLICAVGTVGRRLDDLPAPDIIFVDEAHHSVAGTWSAIISKFDKARIVGLTATPERLDGRGLGDVFTALVPGPPVRDLMDDGWLADYRAWSHAPPDLSHLKMRGKDYDPEALSATMSNADLIGDVVEHYMEHAAGERGVAFCVDVNHSLRMRDAFRDAGVRCEQLDGSAPKEVRRRVTGEFKRGEVEVLTSVDLFGEGYDLPELAVAILARPSKSLSLILQQCGRTFRPVWADGFDLDTRSGRLDAIAHSTKPCAKLLDHAGNLRHPDLGGHGLPDDHREWTLEGRKKSSRASGGSYARICPKCFGASPPRTEVCQYGCGHVFVMTPRELEEAAGDLKEIEREQARIHTASQPVPDNFLEAVHILMARGGTDPATQAYWILSKRGIAISESDYIAAMKVVAKHRNYKPGWVQYKVRLWRQRAKPKVAA